MSCQAGKRRYRTPERAQVALVSARAAAVLRKGNRRREQRIYRCPFCVGWHLTSQERAA